MGTRNSENSGFMDSDQPHFEATTVKGPATTEMFLFLYLSTNKSIVSLKAFGSSKSVVTS